jgi:2-polyprenyl-3-methyl-5-hydroxy-6-metoxy-1,4-benzoquinol methylase
MCENEQGHQKTMDVTDFKRGKDYIYLRCSECGLVFLNPFPTEEELGTLYELESQLYEEDTEGFASRMANLLAGSREGVVASVSRKPGKILDVGCGLGVFAKRMRERGWDAYGFEISQSAADKAKERVGNDKIFDTWDQIPRNWFDVVTLWHVLEHVQDPVNLIQKIRDSLKLGGWLVIEVPNFNSLSLQVFKESYIHHRIPDHVLYWSKMSLVRLLSDENFEVSKIWCPVIWPLTFSKTLKNRSPNSLLAKVGFALSIPISIAGAFAGAMAGRGEFIRVCVKKMD